MWSDEQRKAASERAKKRWADKDFKQKMREVASSPPLCPSCGETEVAKFYQDKSGKRTNAYCRDCHKTRCKERWHARSWVDRWSSRAYKYGVTPQFLLDLYDKQEGKCALCEAEPQTERGLHVDHCHATQRVRGLLCHGCNTGIGALKEDPKIFSKAISYLKGR